MLPATFVTSFELSSEPSLVISSTTIQLSIMDQSDIYVNAEGASGNRSKWTREIRSPENIYANQDEIYSLESNRTGPALSGNEHIQSGVYT